MNRRIFIRNIMTASAGITLVPAPLAAFTQSGAVALTLLHTNDLHSHIEPFEDTHPNFAGRAGMEKIAQFVKQCRQENPNLLLLDAGDFSQGTPYFNYFGGEMILEMMTKIGYDAGTIGNHEFDNGVEGLSQSLRGAGFPLINSNYGFAGTPLERKIKRYAIFNKGGIKIGIYGLGIALEGLVNMRHAGNVVYNDPLEAALRMEKYLAEKRKCDFIICLSHLGLRYQYDRISDVTLAPQTIYTDVIIGGHTHSYLEEPLVIKNKNGRDVFVNQAHYGGLMVGRLDFVFEKMTRRKQRLAHKLNHEI